MFELLWTIPAFPLAGFLVLALAGHLFPRRRYVAAVGVGSVALSAVVSVSVAVRFLTSPPDGEAVVQTLWTWMAVGDFEAAVSFQLDPLSLVMILVVTVVGALIHLYSAEYMLEDPGYARFFAYMNLFVFAMLILVLADNLVLLYLGWEGVGLCSYLLIGFWYENPDNGRAARKAFIVTRVGDTAMALGLFLLFRELGTLNIQELLTRAEAQWEVGSGLAIAAAALLFGGAMGKSAQVPLQTWLPDAMAGPTPVSALIHAATMVTAGVYLIARTHGLFLLAPDVLTAVAIIGAATILVAGTSALTQRDIKRILAYSTISQLGFMFLALGVGAWAAAIFHLMTHAFFKALLFLGAGAVILAQHHEQDIFRMGGLRKRLPVTFVVFVIAGASLAGFPFLTAGFYSKDTLLWAAWASERGSFWLWLAGLVGAFITALYIFRLIFVVFFGEPRTSIDHHPGYRIKAPLVVLAILSMIGGFVEIPENLGGMHFFSQLLGRTLPAPVITHHEGLASEASLMGVATIASLAGIALAYLLFLRRHRPEEHPEEFPGIGHRLHRFWYRGWEFDRLYDALFVRPFVALARVNKDDVADRLYTSLAALATLGHRAVRTTQTGRLRWYAAGLAFGTVLVIALVGLT